MNFLSKHAVKAGAVPTHNGMPGKYFFEGYESNVSVREELFKLLDDAMQKGEKYCLMENIVHLQPEFKTRFRIDFDVHAESAEADYLDPNINQLVSTVFDVLDEYCGISSTPMVLLKKPQPTKVFNKDGSLKDFKHGAKLCFPELKCTHTEMRQLRTLLLQRYKEWGNEAWLGGKPALQSQVLDDCVYKANGWIMFGSQKKEQVGGGYAVVHAWTQRGQLISDYTVDMSFKDLQRSLSIFADPDDDAVVELTWEKTPPQQEVYTSSKKRAASGAQSASKRPRAVGQIEEVLSKILTQAAGDNTSTFGGRTELHDNVVQYRFARTCASECVYGETHNSNGGYLQLDTGGFVPVVRYICLSEKCSRGAVELQCSGLAAEWARLEWGGGEESFSDDTLSTSSELTGSLWADEQDEPYEEGCSVRHPSVEEFNKYHFMLNDGTTYIAVDEQTGELQHYCKQAFTNRYEHFGMVEVDWAKRPVMFILAWFRSSEKRRYSKLAMLPPPLLCPDNVYNTWTPFAGKLLLQRGVVPDPSAVSVFIAHMSLMVSHDPECLKYTLDFYAQLIQQPGIVPGVALVYKSKPGSGKGVIMRLIHRLLGPSKSITTTKVKDVFGEFNEALENILVDFDDTDTAEMYKYSEPLKHTITEGQWGTTIRRMYRKPETGVRVFARFICKGQGGVKVEEDDRRFLVLDVSNERVGDLEYGRQTDMLFQKEESVAAVYKFLEERDISSANLPKKPTTSSAISMNRVNIPPYVRLLHLIAVGPTNDDVAGRERADGSVDTVSLRPVKQVIEVTSAAFSSLYNSFWEVYYKKADKQSSPMDMRTLSSKLIELTKDVLGHGNSAVSSGMATKTISLHKAADGKRKQAKGYCFDRQQMLAYFAQRYHLKPEIETDMMSIDDNEDFWSKYREPQSQMSV